MEICSKIYYKKEDGTVLLITSEMSGQVLPTTIKEDFELYPNLQGYTQNDVDIIELEYGTFKSKFDNAKSYTVNIDTKELEIVYYTDEELEKLYTEEQYNAITNEDYNNN